MTSLSTHRREPASGEGPTVPISPDRVVTSVGKYRVLSDLGRGVTGEIHHVDCGYHIVGMKNPDAPDITVNGGGE